MTYKTMVLLVTSLVGWTACIFAQGTERDRRDVSWYLVSMPRLARIVAVNIPHHVTQRGNAKQHLLSSDAERTVYLGQTERDMSNEVGRVKSDSVRFSILV